MIFLYTDGSRKRGYGGWSFVAVSNGVEMHRDTGFAESTSNNRMELTAILAGLAWSFAKQHLDICIVTDSQYAISVLTRPVKPNPFPLPVNHDLIKQARSMLTTRIKFSWVKGHSGHEWNELADKLATDACLSNMPESVKNSLRKKRGDTARRLAPARTDF